MGGGLNYVVGPMGAGKSLYGTRRIVDALISAKYVITNIELKEDAFDRIGKHYAPLSTRKAAKVSLTCERHFIFETSLKEAIKYRVPGRGEARGVFIWDEGHNDLNNRNWRERRMEHDVKKTGRDKEGRQVQVSTGRDELLEWATQLRKLGFVGYLLSQHQNNTDAQLRRVCNFLIKLQNQRENIRLLGLRATPWPLFLAYWYQANAADNQVMRVPPTKVERYFLSWHRHLYDTFGLFHGLTADENERGIKMLPEGGLPIRYKVIENKTAIEIEDGKSALDGQRSVAQPPLPAQLPSPKPQRQNP